MLNTIVLAGYSGHSVAELALVAKSMGALVVDIRLSPRSRMPQWNYASLTQQMPKSYLHCPELGNENYKRGEIRIANPEKGLDFVTHLAQLRPLILLCICKEAEHCHRTTVGEMLQLQGYEVEELAWPHVELSTQVEETA